MLRKESQENEKGKHPAIDFTITQTKCLPGRQSSESWREEKEKTERVLQM